MTRTSPQSAFVPLAKDTTICSRVARTEHVRIEVLHCRNEATLQWSVASPDFSLMWVRDKGSNARITVSGGQSDIIAPGHANFWFFPEGVGAEGELTGRGAYDCAAVSVDPTFLPAVARQSLAKPMTGFSHPALCRAFDNFVDELAGSNEVLPLFTDGWAMQALAYVACTPQISKPKCAFVGSGLAPWQLRRAKEIFRADLSENHELQRVAAACKLSVSHFARAFKISTGVPPHQWLMTARIEMARDLLEHSHTPLVEVAGMCGFADQSHFSRVFARSTSTSPGAWRREHWNVPVS